MTYPTHCSVPDRKFRFTVYNNRDDVRIPGIIFAVGVLWWLGFVPWGGHLYAEPAPQSPTSQPGVSDVFRDSQRVTAVDVLATYRRPAVGRWATGKALPDDLSADDFTLVVGDRTAEVVAMAPADSGRWRFVLYFDAVLTSPETIHWAATLFSRHLDSLLALGDVEVVLADPLPRYVLKPGENADEASRVLAQLALQPKAGAQLQRLRDDFLGMVAEQSATPEVVEFVVAEERRQVRRRHDQLITWLVDSDDDDRPADADPTDRRALFYISDGFDARPEAFYGPFLEPHGETASPRAAESLDGPAHPSFGSGQILASYGWVALPMLPPEPELVTRGLRLGKFLIRPVGLHMTNAEPEETARADQHGLRGLIQRLNQIFFGGVHMTYEEHRDKDKAEAYLELATALHGQDKLEDAADAYNKALFHFSGDPRTADRQAVAMAGVGEMLAQLGDRLGAQKAYRKALSLNPNIADDVGTGIAFIDPVGAFRPWTEATVGAVIRRADDLTRFFDTAAARVRLTYQLATAPTGTHETLEIRTPSLAGHWEHPAWTRSGTPPTVTEARLRQVLDAALQLHPVVDGDVTRRGGAAAPIVYAHTDDGTLQLTVRRPAMDPDLALAEDGAPVAARLRLSMASAAADGPTVIVHRPLTLAGSEITLDPGDALDPDAQAWAVIVEDLVTGSRQVRLLELP